MNWTVLHEKNNKIILTSVSASDSGLLPTGSFITVDMALTSKTDNRKFVLRVVESSQISLFNPTPLLADLNIDVQEADRECKNQVAAYRVFNINPREDGIIDFIKPQSLARLSTADEIRVALSAKNKDGVSVFPATIYSSRSQKIRDTEGQPVSIVLPGELFWHQIQISGKTGSGKTVAAKYLADYFVNNKFDVGGLKVRGAVLAINVKDFDFLNLDKKTTIVNSDIEEEWNALGIKPIGNTNFTILHSAHEDISGFKNQGINTNLCKPITLKAAEIRPEALLGIVENLTDIAQQALPDIFRHWQNSNSEGVFNQFLDFIDRCIEEDYNFPTLSVSNRQSQIRLNPSTVRAMKGRLESASEFFEDPAGQDIKVEEIITEGRTTVVEIGSSMDFGSIVLRFLLNRIVELKRESDIPLLIIIDEVHQFYGNNASRAALGDLDTICRTGRSRKIGVIFASQNQNDIPSGLTSVINTKLLFKSDDVSKRIHGFDPLDVMSLSPGYCVSNIHGVPQLKACKFPMSPNGVL